MSVLAFKDKMPKSYAKDEILNFRKIFRVSAKFKVAMDPRLLEQNEEESITNKNDMAVK